MLQLLSFNSNVDPGAQRYFQMFFIVTKFSELKKKDIASQEIWDHLEEMYDLESLVSWRIRVHVLFL